ncbi:hypothetical protein AeRB84_019408 [Aphanomyces euteiches]|nr:hypothetical protein AeRB84_019408 [Aphanomyces euteiches]
MSKCNWGRTSVAFLGHIVTPAGILPNPEKVKSVLKIRPLKSVAEVRAFLGLARYFRRFIQGFAAISRPLEKLKTAKVFEWTPECDDALNNLKRKLVSPPILAYPNFDETFFIMSDACPIAVGAVLMQRQNGRDRVIHYASQALDATQQKWIHKKDGISEIECYGIVWATKKFRPYIDRRPFIIYTDHSALSWLFKTGSQSSNGKLARWAVDPGTDLLDPGEEQDEADVNEEERDEAGDSEPNFNEPGDSDRHSNETRSVPSDNLPTYNREKYHFPVKLLRTEQAKDPFILTMKGYLVDKALPVDPETLAILNRTGSNFIVDKNILYQRTILKSPLRNPTFIRVPVIPLTMIRTVLELYHDSSLSGHFGVTRTADRVKWIGYWKGWRKDVSDYCKKCLPCGAAKGTRPWKQGRMQRMPVYKLRGPFNFLVVDALGPFPPTPQGNKYVLIFVDYFTLWPEAFAVRDLKTSTFVRILVDEILCRYGVPDHLLSDRGTNFVSELAKTMYKTLGIDKLASAPMHLQGHRIRRMHADYNQSGSVKNSESLLLMDGGFTHLFLVLTWNLMCRSVSTQQIRFEHLSYEEDAIGVRFFKTKTDQAGEKYRDPKHLYANPLCPTTCVFLAFAIYFASNPQLQPQCLFPGGSQRDRFGKCLSKLALIPSGKVSRHLRALEAPVVRRL